METQEKTHKRKIADKESQKVLTAKTKDLSKQTTSDEDEIDLIDLIKKLWAQRKIVWITTACFFILGFFIAVFSPEEYEAEIILLPQSGGSASMNISSGLLRQFGIGGIGGGNSNANDGLSMTLYPDITHSTPFLIHLLDEEVYFSNIDTTVTFLSYFSEIDNKKGFAYHLKRYTIGLPALLIKLPLNLINSFKARPPSTSNSNSSPNNIDIISEIDTSNTINNMDRIAYLPMKLTAQQLSVMNELRNRIITTVEENGTLMVSSKMPDPYVAARTTELAATFLTNYIKEYRTDKVQADLKFVQQQYEDKEARYNRAQQKLANLRDRNTNIVSESARIELARAQTEFDLAFNLYQSVAQQLEQAQIKVQEETPLFKVLEPVQVPLRKSEPNQELIIIMFTFVGLFLGLGFIFLKVFYQHVKQNF